LSIAAGMAVADSTFVIVSGKTGGYWQPGTLTEGTGGTTVTVNEATKYQKWYGFGGCFNEAGWAAIKKLSASDKEKAIKLLFDVNDGIGFTWCRIPIGASDYALTRYTLNETAGDTAMTNFSIAHDKDYLIPFVKAAQAVKPDLLFCASPWTPPTWMKEPVGFDGGAMKNDPKFLRANALYLAKFAKAYKAEGITIKALFPQNEPGYTQNYPSCGWGKYRNPDNSNVNTTEYLSTFVADYLAPILKTESPETDIWAGTFSNDTYGMDYWNGVKSKAGTVVKGVGLQWGCVKYAKQISSAGGYIVMQSEHRCGNYPWLSSKSTNLETADSTQFVESAAPNNQPYGEESWRLITTWIKEGVNIYSAWNLILDSKGFNLDEKRKWPQNALLTVDMNAGTLKVTPAYYVFRHVAQYVDTGATRIATTGGDALAFLNPNGSIVTIAYNNTTSAAQTTIAAGGKSWKVTIPAKGWATLCTKWVPPVTTKVNAHNKFTGNGSDLKVTCREDGYRIALPSRESGRIELMTVTGRVLESRAIPQGSREIMLQKQASYAGLLLVRAVYGNETKTTRLFNAR
jgi:glucosylceramidase